jgi:hypothetical protein
MYVYLLPLLYMQIWFALILTRSLTMYEKIYLLLYIPRSSSI